MSALLTITATELRRFLRDRSNLFFVFVLPLLLVVLIGAQFAGGVGTPVGVVAPVDDAVADELVAALDGRDAIRVEVVADVDTLIDAVRRGTLTAGVVITDDHAAGAAAGEVVPVQFLARPGGDGLALRSVVEAVTGPRGAVVDAARGAATVLDGEGDLAELLVLADGLRDVVAGVEVATSAVGEGGLAEEFAGLGQFDLGASSQLFLFVFLTTLTGSAVLIQARQLGVATRMRASATGVSTILLGLAGGRLVIALLQAAYLIIATWLLFDVDWGDPLATGLLVTLFCLVSAGAATVLGALLRNDSQAGGAGVGLGLVLAALGGSMVPLEVFPDGARRFALLTPHGWANTAIAEVVRRDGGVADIALELAVLAGYAAGLLALGTVLLRRALTRPTA